MKYHPGYEIGQRIVESIDKSEGKATIRCSCGRLDEVSTDYLYTIENAGVELCQKCHLQTIHERLKKNQQKHVGEKYNNYLVNDVFSEDGVLKFNVTCDCGESGVVTAQHVYEGDVNSCQSCRPYDRKIYPGYVSDGWEYVREKGGRHYWVCQECGFTISRSVRKSIHSHCPSCENALIEVDGEKITQSELANRYEISRQALNQFIQKKGLDGTLEHLKANHISKEQRKNIIRKFDPKAN